MSDKSQINKTNPGILGYDKSKKGQDPVQIKCPYCWFSHHAKNQVTKHIRENHWEQPDHEQIIKDMKAKK